MKLVAKIRWPKGEWLHSSKSSCISNKVVEKQKEQKKLLKINDLVIYCKAEFGTWKGR